ncbi:HTH domain-containing protein [Streptomyces sp. NPDC048362]|uniref:HTH domain-containing protein n=1 Tax=Streptomyces sp. NPDC048362 TaxID=3365539 RepID=UPI00371758B4
MKFLRTRERGSTKSLAERLGVSRKTVQRYLSGASTKPTSDSMNHPGVFGDSTS